MKHKHCDLIKAWADGADIQYWDKYTSAHGIWRDVCGKDLNWHPEIQYRIKPKEDFLRFKIALVKIDKIFHVQLYCPWDYGRIEDSDEFITWLHDEETVDVGCLR